MKEMVTVIPEFEEGDSVAFLSESGLIKKATVKSIAQKLGEENKLFYHLIQEDKQEVVMPESELLFNDVSFSKPLFNIGVSVNYNHPEKEDTLITSTILGFTLDVFSDIDKDGELIYYTEILYAMEDKAIVSEDDIVSVNKE